MICVIVSVRDVRGLNTVNISGFAVLVMCVECVPIKLCDPAVAVTELLLLFLKKFYKISDACCINSACANIDVTGTVSVYV